MTLESKVAFLRQPTSFQEPTYRVEAIETHMSWVFLTDRHAYKLKKPVRYDFLDFSTIDARRYYCQEELRLNRRLAAEVYLGIVELTLNSAWSFAVRWLWSGDRLADQDAAAANSSYARLRIKNGTASREDVRRVAARLANFYRTCHAHRHRSAQYRGRFACQIEVF